MQLNLGNSTKINMWYWKLKYSTNSGLQECKNYKMQNNEGHTDYGHPREVKYYTPVLHYLLNSESPLSFYTKQNVFELFTTVMNLFTSFTAAN